MLFSLLPSLISFALLSSLISFALLSSFNSLSLLHCLLSKCCLLVLSSSLSLLVALTAISLLLTSASTVFKSLPFDTSIILLLSFLTRLFMLSLVLSYLLSSILLGSLSFCISFLPQCISCLPCLTYASLLLGDKFSVVSKSSSCLCSLCLVSRPRPGLSIAPSPSKTMMVQ